jgi:Uma2 family endonuclease
MRAVHTRISDEELAWRKKTGIDRWDEMWDGVLHMTPAPNVEHQRILGAMIGFLVPASGTRGRGIVLPGINVFGQNGENYRIPDITFVAKDREKILARDGVHGDGPDAVIEIRSPEDETYEKLPFYAAIGVREVLVVDRDSKQPEMYHLQGSQLVNMTPDPGGWVVAEAMRAVPSR